MYICIYVYSDLLSLRLSTFNILYTNLIHNFSGNATKDKSWKNWRTKRTGREVVKKLYKFITLLSSTKNT